MKYARKTQGSEVKKAHAFKGRRRDKTWSIAFQRTSSCAEEQVFILMERGISPIALRRVVSREELRGIRYLDSKLIKAFNWNIQDGKSKIPLVRKYLQIKMIAK